MPTAESTYDISTFVGRTRFHAGDTRVENGVAIWTDAELSYCLFLTGNVPELAAARALRMGAADASKLAIVSKTDSVTTDLREISVKMLAAADALEAQCFVVPYVIAPDAVFTTGKSDGSTVGTLDVW